MDMIVGLLALSVPVVFLWGLISLFRRGKRARGLSLVLTSFILMAAAGELVPADDGAQDNLSVESEPIPELAQAAAGEEELPGGWLDAETMAKAAERGIQRADAYKLINDQSAIDRFCEYEVQSFALSDEQTAKMAAEPDASNRDAVWTKYQTKQTQLLENINSELGLQDSEFITLSNAGYWNWHCRAADAGWKVLTVQGAKDATEKDAEEANYSLTAFYLYQLDNETAHLFDNSRFDASSCRTRQLDGNQFVACQLRSVADATKWQMFILGRDSSGNLLVAPVNGDTETNVTRSGKSKELDDIARARTYLEAYDEPRAYLAKYAGPPLPVDKVRELFE